MKRLSTPIKVTACIVLLIAMAVLLAPQISRFMGILAASETSTSSAVTEKAAETGLDVPFLADLASADSYGYIGLKSVSGQDGSYSMEFACAVSGKDFVLKTQSFDHEYRQIYQNGRYLFVDDTAKTIQEDLLKYDFLDANLIGAIDGKIIRRSGEIIDGNPANRVEIYKDGTVYAYYFNQKGVLIRFYYIYEGNEVRLDLEKITLGGSCCASFDIPSAYRVN